MERIETLSLDQFATYLSKTKNTICGRHPIGVLLGMVEDLYPGFERQSEQEPEVEEGDIKDKAPYLKFIHYSQSSQVTDPSDSSVSYAAAYLYLPPN
jgi:predicted class III extradiol MEMO1 family dioxygenase